MTTLIIPNLWTSWPFRPIPFSPKRVWKIRIALHTHQWCTLQYGKMYKQYFFNIRKHTTDNSWVTCGFVCLFLSSALSAVVLMPAFFIAACFFPLSAVFAGCSLVAFVPAGTAVACTGLLSLASVWWVKGNTNIRPVLFKHWTVLSSV